VNRNFKLYLALNVNNLRLYSWQHYIVSRYVVLTKEADVLSPVIRNTLSSSHCSRVSIFLSAASIRHHELLCTYVTVLVSQQELTKLN